VSQAGYGPEVMLISDAEIYTNSYTFFGNTVHYPSRICTTIHYTNNSIAYNLFNLHEQKILQQRVGNLTFHSQIVKTKYLFMKNKLISQNHKSLACAE